LPATRAKRPLKQALYLLRPPIIFRLAYLVIFLFTSILLSSCVLKEDYSPEEYAINFLDDTAKNCGEVLPESVSIKVENCIFSSLENHTPFYTWYWLRPEDSEPASGLIFNSNKELFVAWYGRGLQSCGTFFQTTKCQSWEIQDISGKRMSKCRILAGEKAYLFNMEKFAVIENE